MMFHNSIHTIFAFFVYIFIASCASDHEWIGSSNLAEHRTKRQILDTLNRTNNGDNSTAKFQYMYDFLYKHGHTKMCGLIKEAKIEAFLETLGEFTLLVPSNVAFELLPGSTNEEFRALPDKKKDFVLGHIVPSTKLLKELQPFDEITLRTVRGAPMQVTAYNNKHIINGANVIEADKKIDKSMNIMNVVDKVLYPAPNENMVDAIKKNYGQMASYIVGADLENILKRKGLTFFVPTDDAFRAIPWSITEKMLTNSTFTKQIIENHIIFGRFYSIGLPANQVHSLGAELLTFDKVPVQSRDYILVNSIPIVRPDEVTTNGIIHGIPRLILPKELQEKCECKRKFNETESSGLTTSPPQTTYPNDYHHYSPVNRGLTSTPQSINYQPYKPIRRAPVADPSADIPAPKNIWDGILPTAKSPTNRITRKPFQWETNKPVNERTTPFGGSQSPFYRSYPTQFPGERRATIPFSRYDPRNITPSYREDSYPSTKGGSSSSCFPGDPRCRDAITKPPSITQQWTTNREKENRETTTLPSIQNVNHQSQGTTNGRIYRPTTPSTPFFPNSRSTPAEAITIKPRKEELKPDTQTIDQIIDDPGLELNEHPVSFSMFKDSMNRAGLSNILSSPGPLTIFMPTNAAFQTIPPKTMNKLQRNPLELRNLLLRHIANERISPNDLRNNLKISTFSRELLNVNIQPSGKQVLIDEVPIKAATSAQNGIIYVMDMVLLPSQKEMNDNLIDQLQNNSKVSNFLRLLRRTYLPQRLKGQGPFTILAPLNSAFEEITPEIRRELEQNPRLLRKFVGNHIVSGGYDLEKLGVEGTAKRQTFPIKVTILPGAIVFNDVASLVKPNIRASNGVIHLINRLLIPDDEALPSLEEAPINSKDRYRYGRRRNFEEKEKSKNLKDLANSMDSDRFLQWINNAGLLNDLLQRRGQNTLIIPSDEAVKKLPKKIQDAIEKNPAQFKSLLKYHIIPKRVDFKDMKDGEKITTLSGKDITYNKYKNETLFTLGGSPIMEVSLKDDTLVITVDRVLYPPQGSLYDIVSKSPLLKVLHKLIDAAKLKKQFSEPGAYTLFAPTDKAFDKLSSGTVKQFEKASDSSRALLLRHVVRPLIYTSAVDLQNSTQVENVIGEKLTLQRKPGCVSIDGITLTYADISADNGIIHVIDHVL